MKSKTQRVRNLETQKPRKSQNCNIGTWNIRNCYWNVQKVRNLETQKVGNLESEKPRSSNQLSKFLHCNLGTKTEGKSSQPSEVFCSYLVCVQGGVAKMIFVLRKQLKVGTVPIYSCLVLLTLHTLASGANHVSSLELFFSPCCAFFASFS